MLKFKVESRSLDCLGISTLFRVLVTSTSVSCNTSVCCCSAKVGGSGTEAPRCRWETCGAKQTGDIRWHLLILCLELLTLIDTLCSFQIFSNLFNCLELFELRWDLPLNTHSLWQSEERRRTRRRSKTKAQTSDIRSQMQWDAHHESTCTDIQMVHDGS
jgi:hypothetical protein